LDKSKIKDVYQLEIPHWETSLRNCLERLAASN
jgi:dTDP-4-dehydrorhamnose reductase